MKFNYKSRLLSVPGKGGGGGGQNSTFGKNNGHTELTEQPGLVGFLLESHGILEWFGWEGTFKLIPLQLLVTPSSFQTPNFQIFQGRGGTEQTRRSLPTQTIPRLHSSHKADEETLPCSKMNPDLGWRFGMENPPWDLGAIVDNSH